MDTVVYYRKFDTKKVIKTTLIECNSFKSFFPTPMRVSLDRALSIKGKISENDWILCPLYDEQNFQIGVTGFVELKEQIKNGAARELGEEIGLIPEKNEYLHLIQENIWYKKDKNHVDFPVFDIYIKNCIPVPEHLDGKKIGQYGDDKNRKVGCYVYGEQIELLKFLESEKIFRYSSGDKIIGVAMVCPKSISKYKNFYV